jgi:signal transduction histidine kinase
MTVRPLPYVVLTAAAAIGALLAIALVWVALSQPWLGIRFGVSEGRVDIVATEGPAAAVPAGLALETIAGAGLALTPEALDLSAEPDGAMGSFDNWFRFLDRQEQLATILRAGSVQLTLEDGRTYTVQPLPQRPLGTLPAAFWVQLLVGCFSWATAAAVFAFRMQDPAARYLLLSGAATLTFASLAGVYSTRELALPGTLFHWFNDLNFLGGTLFTACFVGLLLHYPRRLGPRGTGTVVLGLYLLWFVAQHLGAFESMTFARRVHVLLGVAATFVLAGVHWQRTRQDPAARAALQWFLLSWLLGITLFALVIFVPQLLGIDTAALQGYAFLFVLLVYVGLALGILRYRLFDLGLWWARTLLWLLGMLLLFGLDLVFLSLLHLSPDLSLTLALLLTGLLWLPLRSVLWERVLGMREHRQELALSRIVEVALTPPDQDRDRRWQEFLADSMAALEVAPAARAVAAAQLEDDGLQLLLPAVAGFAPVSLRYAGRGERLFNSHDLERAGELCALLEHAVEARTSYERGVANERSRIFRDMHDNIGAQLLTALHSDSCEQKDRIIREALVDLRALINNVSGQGVALSLLLAELRAETAERLEQAGIRLHWQDDAAAMDGLYPSPDAAHALRSVLREAVSNTIRHSQARNMHVILQATAQGLQLSLSDDGVGISADVRYGNGLHNIRTRIEALGGELAFSKEAPGLGIDVCLTCC